MLGCFGIACAFDFIHTNDDKLHTYAYTPQNEGPVDLDMKKLDMMKRYASSFEVCLCLCLYCVCVLGGCGASDRYHSEYANRLHTTSPTPHTHTNTVGGVLRAGALLRAG